MTWDPPAGRVLRLVALVFLTVAALLLGVWLFMRLWSLIVLAGMAILLATALEPYVDWLARRTKRRGPAVALVTLAVLGAVALFGLLVLPPMVDQVRDLYDRAPELQDRLARLAEEWASADAGARVREFEPNDLINPDLAVRTGLGVLGALVATVTTAFLTLYLLLDAAHVLRFVYFATPERWHVHLRALGPPLREVVGGYLRGQAITSVCIGVFTFVTLTILRVPNALALAGIAMVVDLIPLVGVYILLAATVLGALLVSPLTAAIVAGLMLAYQQVEDRLLVPRVYGATLRLPTIAVVLALLAGAELLGILGAFVALPIAAGARVVVEYFAAMRREGAAAAAAQVQPQGQTSAFAPDEDGAQRPVRSPPS